MENGTATALKCLEGACNQFLSSLSEYLYRHIIRNAVLFDQLSQKVIIMRGSRREAHLNLFESEIN